MKCRNCGFENNALLTECRACGQSLIFREEPKSARKPKAAEPATPAAPEPKTPSLARKYADFMDDETLFQYALCTDQGLGVKQNIEEAMEIYSILAGRGHTESMFRLAERYLEQNSEDATRTAVFWLKLAAERGHDKSKIRLKSLSVQDASMFGMQQYEVSERHGGTNMEGMVRYTLPNIVAVYSANVKRQGNKVVGQSYSAGSGYIVDGGYVITNAHVVGEDPEVIVVQFEPSIDDNTYQMELVAITHREDIAVLRFKDDMRTRMENRQNLSFTLKDVQFGEHIFTIGNPLGKGLSASAGIVSSPNREPAAGMGKITRVIQTDLCLNHGNSGGALLDDNCDVIGMCTYIPTDAIGGMGMCIPAEFIVDFINKNV